MALRGQPALILLRLLRWHWAASIATLVALLRMSHWTVKASQAYLAQVEQGKAKAAPAPYARV